MSVGDYNYIGVGLSWLLIKVNRYSFPTFIIWQPIHYEFLSSLLELAQNVFNILHS